MSWPISTIVTGRPDRENGVAQEKRHNEMSKHPIFKVVCWFENDLKLTYRGRFQTLDNAIMYYRSKHVGCKIIEVKQIGRIKL